MFDGASIPELIRRNSVDAALRNRIALEAADETLTYFELWDRMERIAGALREHGVKREDRLALIGGRNARIVTGFFGAQTAGSAVCVLDPHGAIGDLQSRLKAAQVTWLLYEANCESIANRLDTLHKLRLEDLLGDTGEWLPYLTANEDALLLFTSASTGVAKAVRLSHGNVLANAFGVGERTGLTPDDRVLHAMPLHHTNGTNNQLAVPFAYGASVVMLERFNAETFFEAVAAARPTYITGVPTMYLRLLAHRPPRDALRTLRFLRSGAAPITVDEHRVIEAHLGLPLIMSYGLSEATCTCAMNPPDARRIGTVGTALDGVTVATLEPGSVRSTVRGAEGEICIAGPTVMQGYAGSGSDGLRIENGWLRTGDLGRLDADGYLSITGRIKDLIIRGGENLSPGAIEAALLSHPDVQAACVVGAADADLGEVPIAFVVARERRTLHAAALQAAVRERLTRRHMPKRIIFLDQLPENAMGKIDRRALREQAQTIN